MDLEPRPSIDQALTDEFGPMETVISLEGFPGMYLDHGKWHGIPVTLSTLLPSGQMMVIGTPPQQIIIGNRPHTELELAGYWARRYVQEQLADVLEWLGERVIPWPPVTGREILDGIRRGLI